MLVEMTYCGNFAKSQVEVMMSAMIIIIITPNNIYLHGMAIGWRKIIIVRSKTWCGKIEGEEVL